jgi:CBS domain-containing protein
MNIWFTLVRSRVLTIRFHYTWLLMLPLGVWMLAQLVLPARLGQQSPLWLPALLIASAYVGVVAVHEAAHMLVARWLRVPMPPLDVHPLGTLSRIGYETIGPRRTFAVAAAGPLANICLWFALRPVEATPGTLGGEIVNFARSFTLTLGLINLLPALPLDGGRMLRAMIWSSGDFEQGTRAATVSGYVVVAGMVVAGLRNLTEAETMLRGIWLLLLAWLIYGAGAMLLRRRVVGAVFDRLKARDIMVDAQTLAEPQQTLRTLVEAWRGGTGETPTPVIEDGQLIGWITRSLVADVPQGYWVERTIRTTMQSIDPIATVSPTTPLSHILPRLDIDDLDPSPLFVVEEGRLLGLINPRDIEPLLDVQDVLGMRHPAASPSEQNVLPTNRFAPKKQHTTAA